MIPIFKYETEAGIADVVRSSGAIAYASVAKVTDVQGDECEKLQQMLESQAEANPDQLDLFYLESVLASVGWNYNDDVFDPMEIWTARNTPVDKQFNFMHDETDIIGHLTSSKLVDFDGNMVAEQPLPDRFDIVVGSVLYKAWSDPKLQERMNKIIAEIQDDKWCVSMECLFRNFDYAVVTSEGEHKVVARDDDSSFLTKHLRVYGGTGEFDGNKLGRLLRGFSFSGKGLVDNPANPRSKITNVNDKSEISSFAGASATVDELEISNVQENPMTISQEQYDALTAELEALKASKVAEAQSELDDAKAQISELESSVASVTSELEASKEVANAKDESIDSLKVELEDVKAKLSDSEAKIATQELEATQAARKAQLLEKVDEDRANSLVEKFADASDEMFEALVESLPAKFPPEKDEDKKKKEDKEKKSDASEEVVEETEADTDIDDATASDDADMASGGDDMPADTIAKAASWFTDNVLRSTANNKEGE